LVRQAIVRDIDSSLNLQALGLSREKITVAPDLVFSLKLPVKEVKKEGVCLILRSAPGINAQALANTVAATCKTRGITLGLILFEDELALRNYVKSAMPEVPLVVYEGDFEKLLEVMSGCIGVISMRYHGIVLARMLKREVLVLSYDAKCHFLAKEHNLMEVELGELLGDMSFVRDKVGVFLDEVATNRSQHAY
jgi:polysaccharide pyruvyl transferase WcaK-like protein